MKRSHSRKTSTRLAVLAGSFALALLTILAGACRESSVRRQGSVEAGPEMDGHSYARPDEVVVRHLNLDVTIDFEQRRVTGRATLDIVNLAGARELWLDTRDLDIKRVGLGSGDADDAKTTFRLGDDQPYLGRALVVDIQPDTTVVHIDYSSRPEAAALQWLDAGQTAGGKHPFLLSQGQAILTRTFIPCQDTPAVRITYEATIRVPPGLMALMSAENPTELAADGVYTFRMPQPIPAYLLALAVGELEFRELGPRTGVYAEPEVIDRAAWEFAQTEEMMVAAEELYGPYRWSRYDLIVLPPSFPFGGMENPRLTFVTPTVLAGDRSLVSLIAHELAHSWSGNLVTNATWNDFWLNEGFTVYLEKRIMEVVYGRDYTEMLSKLGRQDLMAAFEELGADSPDTHLYLDLAGRDPDDGMTDVAYEKGYFFLRMLEEHHGRERWDTFLRHYFDTFEFKSITTAEFLEHLQANLVTDPAQRDRLLIDDWIFGPGLPANAPVVESSALELVDAALERWTAGAPPESLATREWSSHEWLHFVRHLPEAVSHEQLARLDAAFDFTGSGNSEILHAWLMQAVRHGYEPAYPALESFLTGMGRRKFLRPLYFELASTPGGAERGRAIYAKARSSYHPVSTATVDAILAWPAGD